MSIVSTDGQNRGDGALLEVVVQHPRDVPGADEGGADRLFVVGDVEAGGLSPEPATVSAVCKDTEVPVRVMLRLNDGLSTTGGELSRLVGLGERLGVPIIGVWVGFLPGLGSSVADWFAYAHAVQTEKNRENFGKGDVRGVIASEGANNAKEGGDYIPTLAFGIPGGTSSALVLTAFIAVGIKPGPDMLTSQLNLTFAVIWTLVIANIIATAVCMLFAKPIAKVCFMPFYAIVPPVVAFVFIGAFAANFHTYDLTLLMVFSTLGFFMRRYGWPRAPLVLGSALVTLGSVGFALDFDGFSLGVLTPVLAMSVGMALVAAPLTTAVMNAAPDTQSGVASGVNNAASRLAGLFAVVGLTGAAVLGATDKLKRLVDPSLLRDAVMIVPVDAPRIANLFKR